MRIGEQAKVDLYLSYTANKAIKVQWPSIGDTITEKIEVVSVSSIDTTFPDKSNSTKILQHQQIIVSVYDSGYYAIPGFKFIVNDDTAHPLYTKPLFLEVHTVPTDTSATKIKDIKSPLEEPFNWEWYIDYLYGITVLLAIILATVIITAYVVKRRSVKVIEPDKPKVPAHIVALATLEKIRQESVWQEGKVKEYYSAISDSVRLYIEDRFGVFALESTTDEIMTAFRSQVVDRESKDKLQQLLMLSDLVKFAKQFPIEAEHHFTLQNAFDFVNGTKREEEVQLDETGTTILDGTSPGHFQNPVNHSQNTSSTVNAERKYQPLQENIKTENISYLKEPGSNKTKGINKVLLIALIVIGFIIVFLASYYVINKLVSGSPDGEEISQTNQNYPVMINSETRLDSMVVGDDNTTKYFNTLVNVMYGQIDVDAVKDQIRPTIISSIKTSPEYKDLRERSGIVQFQYNDRTGRPLFLISISPEDYLN